MLTPFHRYVDLVEWCLRHLTDLTGNFGVAIILFTILLKTVMLPLTVKSIKSTAAMQELQPKIKELQKKYGKDRQRLSQETMKLYAEYKINPASGCLPLLLQIPIFFGLYYGVRDLSKDASGFLWIDNLSKPDPIYLLPILAGVFQLIQTRMMRPANAPKVTDPQQAMMQTMMNFMPLMVVVFGWNFAAGPVLYWVTQSAYSVVQQWFITGWGSLKSWFPWLPELPEHRRLGHRKEPLQSHANEGEEVQVGGLMGRMQRRMTEMEDRQSTRQAQRRPADRQRKQEPEDEPGGPRIVRARPGAYQDSDDVLPAAETTNGKRARRTRVQTSAPGSRESDNVTDVDASGVVRPKTVPRRARPSR